ncbi:MAG: 2,3-bisphosphoglycerate-independent phosphoglycerate mutase [Chitinophagaceae bacterium]|nr:2,3-bisphosphoglycerate-independent phosphoglycerate mutase [Chitinophagaceae bacterium]
MSKKSFLIIMDGWGLGQIPEADAIRAANTPFVDSLYQRYPHSQLMTCGECVGLPSGQMGNSEVGHLNIGAGRIVYQELERINVAFRKGSFEANPTVETLISYCETKQKPLHLIGLLSDGGVHSHIEHFKKIIDICHSKGLTDVYIHVFTDGRDTDPKSGLGFLRAFKEHIDTRCGKIASVCGRYYAMDRDKRWERVKLAYDALVHGVGQRTHNVLNDIEASYHAGITDEFIKPLIVCDDNEKPIATIQEGDAVFCVNFRTDRCREITQALTQQDFPEQGMNTLPLHYVTMTEYDKTYKGIDVIFRNDDLKNTLGEVLAKAGKKQIRIAETEKYPHVTFFFSGGREQEFEGERRLMAPSPKDVATYDLKPEMSAHELTNLLLPEIKHQQADFICLNFANADMVGHTGVWDAVIKAVETVDHCVEQLVTEALRMDYTVFLTADHGNSDYMINDDGSPNTAHTLNPVPFFIISNYFSGPIKDGKLGDIAPTILHFMDMEIPSEMTGDCLV